MKFLSISKILICRELYFLTVDYSIMLEYQIYAQLLDMGFVDIVTPGYYVVHLSRACSFTELFLCSSTSLCISFCI